MSDVQRREFLTGAAAFAATTATLGGTRPAAADDKPPRPIRGDKGASIIGPTNPARESQNRYLEVWKTDKFSDVSLRQWLAFTPFGLVQAHLKIDRSVLANIPTRKTPVVPV